MPRNKITNRKSRYNLDMPEHQLMGLKLRHATENEERLAGGKPRLSFAAWIRQKLRLVVPASDEEAMLRLIAEALRRSRGRPQLATAREPLKEAFQILSQRHKEKPHGRESAEIRDRVRRRN